VKLTNPEIGTYRFRIGEYRIAFDISEDTLIVHAVGHRRGHPSLGYSVARGS
jgi:mRNA interferase RelE/StbE